MVSHFLGDLTDQEMVELLSPRAFSTSGCDAGWMVADQVMEQLTAVKDPDGTDD